MRDALWAHAGHTKGRPSTLRVTATANKTCPDAPGTSPSRLLSQEGNGEGTDRQPEMVHSSHGRRFHLSPAAQASANSTRMPYIRMWLRFTASQSSVRSSSRKRGKRPHGVRQRKGLVASAAERVRGEEWRIGLHQQQIRRRDGRCRQSRGVAEADRAGERHHVARGRRTRRPSRRRRRSSGRPPRPAAPSAASTSKHGAWASRSWIISALPVRLASSMCQANASRLRRRAAPRPSSGPVRSRRSPPPGRAGQLLECPPAPRRRAGPPGSGAARRRRTGRGAGRRR